MILTFELRILNSYFGFLPNNFDWPWGYFLIKVCGSHINFHSSKITELLNSSTTSSWMKRPNTEAELKSSTRACRMNSEVALVKLSSLVASCQQSTSQSCGQRRWAPRLFPDLFTWLHIWQDGVKMSACSCGRVSVVALTWARQVLTVSLLAARVVYCTSRLHCGSARISTVRSADLRSITR